jgi:hypothetical protein
MLFADIHFVVSVSYWLRPIGLAFAALMYLSPKFIAPSLLQQQAEARAAS